MVSGAVICILDHHNETLAFVGHLPRHYSEEEIGVP